MNYEYQYHKIIDYRKNNPLPDDVYNGWNFYKVDKSNNPGSTGMCCWNNDIEMCLSKECPGPEWKRGMIKRKNPKN